MIAQNLARLRSRFHLTQEEVAEQLRAAGLEILESRQSEGWFSYTCR